VITNRFNVLSESENFLGLQDDYSSFEKSSITILPCPYERTTSYGKGTANGPAAILKSSHYLEFFDEEIKREVCFEQGISVLQPLRFEGLKDEDCLALINQTVYELLRSGKFVITLGGEHTLSCPVINAFFNHFQDLSILQFDAHSDLRDQYQGTKYSHACFAARIAEFTRDITQVGIRALCKEEFEFIENNSIHTFFAHDIRKKEFDNKFIDSVISTLKKNVYITFDVDYFDPSIMPSTGTPEPNGFYWDETMRLLRRVIKKRNLVGFDVVELAPKEGLLFPDFLTAKLVYRMIGYKFVAND